MAGVLLFGAVFMLLGVPFKLKTLSVQTKLQMYEVWYKISQTVQYLDHKE